jgi:hypothetical protein
MKNDPGLDIGHGLVGYRTRHLGQVENGKKMAKTSARMGLCWKRGNKHKGCNELS